MVSSLLNCMMEQKNEVLMKLRVLRPRLLVMASMSMVMERRRLAMG